MKNKDVIIAVVLIVLGVLGYIKTYYFPQPSIWSFAGSGERYTTTAATWPRIVLVTFFGLNLLLIIVSLTRKKGIQTKEKIGESLTCSIKDEFANESKDLKRALTFGLLVFGYLVLLEYLGFAIDTVIFGLACVICLGYREITPWKGVLIILFISMAIVFLFCRILYLPLPRGVGLFRSISEFVIY